MASVGMGGEEEEELSEDGDDLLLFPLSEKVIGLFVMIEQTMA